MYMFEVEIKSILHGFWGILDFIPFSNVYNAVGPKGRDLTSCEATSKPTT